ncbi:hypothetical protein [Clostridium sp.]
MNTETKEVIEMLTELEKIDQSAIRTIKELVKTLHQVKKKNKIKLNRM